MQRKRYSRLPRFGEGVRGDSAGEPWILYRLLCALAHGILQTPQVPDLSGNRPFGRLVRHFGGNAVHRDLGDYFRFVDDPLRTNCGFNP